MHEKLWLIEYKMEYNKWNRKFSFILFIESNDTKATKIISECLDARFHSNALFTHKIYIYIYEMEKLNHHFVTVIMISFVTFVHQ